MKKILSLTSMLLLLICVFTVIASADGYTFAAADLENEAYLTAEKTAYIVSGYYALGGSRYIDIMTVDGLTKVEGIKESTSFKLYQEDVVVGALIDDVFYFETTSKASTYVVGLNWGDGTVFLNGIGNVKYKDLTVNGVYQYDLYSDMPGLGADRVFYIYNGELVYADPLLKTPQYEIAVLEFVEKVDNEYYANIIENGTSKRLLLDDYTYAGEVDGVNYTAEQMYDMYKKVTTPEGDTEYKFTTIAYYRYLIDGYRLFINKNLDEDAYAVIPANSVIKYSYITGLWTIGGNNKIIFDQKGKMFCKYQETMPNGTKKWCIGTYNSENIPDENIQMTTADVSYVVYDRMINAWYLVSTMLDGKIVSPKESYNAEVLYAPENSFIELIGGKQYNSYVFTDYATLLNKEPITNQYWEYDPETNGGSTAGNLYAWNEEKKLYEKLSGSDISSMKTADIAYVNDVIPTHDLIEYKVEDTTYFAKVDESVTVWGLSQKDSPESIKKITFSELCEMYEKITEYNDKCGTSVTVDIILIYSFTDDGDRVLVSVITELFEADEYGVVHSLNDTIFKNLGISSDVTVPMIVDVDMTVYVEKQVSLPIKIVNNTGISNAELEIVYPEGFEFTGVTEGSALSTLDMTYSHEADMKTVIVKWNGEIPDTSEGIACYLDLEVKESCVVGAHTAEIKFKYACDTADETVLPDMTVGINVKAYMSGDANGDLSVDSEDVDLLRKYIAGGYAVTIDTDAMDVDRDGDLDIKDIILVRRYLDGGFGVELK